MSTQDVTALAVREAELVRAEDFMPLMSVQQATQRKSMINSFISGVMKESEDYGSIPGASQKKVLLKPGAEKLCSIFGLSPQYLEDKIIEDWTGEEHGGEPLFYYSYRCSLSRGGRFMGEGIGSCNSWESKYRYRWVREDQLPAGVDKKHLVTRGGKQTLFAFDFQLEKAETTGPYGKPAEYWQAFKEAVESGRARRVQKDTKGGKKPGWEYDTDATLYRIPNPEVADVVNTCQKMAQKRALVAAILVVTNCSDAFTQDIEDFAEMEPSHAPVPDEPAPHKDTKSSPKPAEKPLEVPEQLRKPFAMLEKDPTVFGNLCQSLMNMMMDKAGAVEGQKTYDKITDDFYDQFPNGTKELKVLRGVLYRLWQALEALPQGETK